MAALLIILALVGLIILVAQKRIGADLDCYAREAVVMITAVVTVVLSAIFFIHTPRHEYVQAKQTSFAKTTGQVLVEADGFARVFSDAETYNTISEQAPVYIHYGYNHFGMCLDTEIVLKKP